MGEIKAATSESVCACVFVFVCVCVCLCVFCFMSKCGEVDPIMEFLKFKVLQLFSHQLVALVFAHSRTTPPHAAHVFTDPIGITNLC